ncbi:MAG: NUDIX domain-containing protein [Eubacterium sp.]|nr:NUDIX domain-containing protein [Eubacterium sp.]
MELWDLYDREGNRTGEIWERRHGKNNLIPEGRYHLVGDVLVKHKDGSFLLTQRHPDKDVYPAYWDASAGGSAQLGEEPLECAKRELFEETGIKADNLELIDISFRDKSHSYIYSYIAYVDCDKESVVLQEEEAVDYRWVDAEGLLKYAESDLAIITKVQRYQKVYDSIRNGQNELGDK